MGQTLNIPLDPCSGKPLGNVNWQQAYKQSSNTPLADECRGPPTLFLCDWDESTTELKINTNTICALLEWSGSAWIKISDFNPAAELGASAPDIVIVRQISRFGSEIWVSTSPGFILRSTDGAQSWEVIPASLTNNVSTTIDITPYFDKATDGRIWMAQEDGNNGTSFGAIHYSDDNGQSWIQSTILPVGGYLNDANEWGPHHVVSCHPTNSDIVIVAFTSNEIDPNSISARYVYITQDRGESWTTIKLPGQFGDGSGITAEGFFATGDQYFDGQGRFYIAYEVEEYDGGGPFVPGPNAMHHFYVAWTDDYSSFSVSDVTPFMVTHFGFTFQLYVYGDILHVAWTQEFDELDPFGFNGFDGLASFMSRSDDKGESWTLLDSWLQPTNTHDTMPGYPEDLFYDPDSDECWLFFGNFDDTAAIAGDPDLADKEFTFQWKVPNGGGKVSAHSELVSASGIPVPRTKWASVTRPWPPI